MLQTVGSNVARANQYADHDPSTLSCLGFLIEEARTNLLTYSEDLTNAAWAKGSSTISANSTTAPDGTSTADKLVEDAGALTFFGVTQAITAVGGAAVFYVFIKQAGRTQVELRSFGASTNAVIYSLIDGSVVSGDGSQRPAVQCADGWWRLGITTTTGNTSFRISTAVSGSRSYTGNGVDGIYVWGAGVEVGAFPTSYIATTTAAATRAADVAVMTGSNFSSWYNQTEGVVVSVASGNTNTPTRYVLAINDGTSNEIIYQRLTSTNANNSVADGGVSQMFLSEAIARDSDSFVKQATGYKSNDFGYSVNGLTPQSDTSGTIPTPSAMYFGSLLGASVFLNGRIKSISYYPARLSNATLQALSI